MQYSKTGLALTEQFEGLRLQAYLDQGGKPTIGFGHTGLDVHLGMTCSKEQAEAWLLADIDWAVKVVNTLVKVDLSQGQFEALVDFCFNVGAGNFADSTLLALVNKGDFENAAAQFERWDLVHGKVSPGLLARRLAERKELSNA